MVTKKTTPASGQKSRGAESSGESSKGTPAKKPASAIIMESSRKSEKAGTDHKSDAPNAKAAGAKPATDKKPDAGKKSKPQKKPEAAKPAPKPPEKSRKPMPAPKSKGRGLAFAGFVTGGIIAAAIGYFGAEYLNPQVGLQTRNAANIAALRGEYTARLSKLSNRVAALEAGKNASALAQLRAQLGVLKAAVDKENKAVATQLAEAEKRLNLALDQLAALQKRQVRGTAAIGNGISAATSDIIAQYGEKIDALKKQMQAQIKARAALAAKVDAVSKVATQQLSAAREKVSELSKTTAKAMKAVDLTRTRERLRAAVETGKSYAGLLAKLASEAAVDIPAALLSGADTGIVPLARLQQDFPEAARRALKASIRAQAANGGFGAKVLAFLKSQIGARSLAEKAGNGPDAILSRAQAALDQGKLQAAVNLVRKLPDAGVAEMSGWLAAADARLAAKAALDKFESSFGSGN